MKDKLKERTKLEKGYIKFYKEYVLNNIFTPIKSRTDYTTLPKSYSNEKLKELIKIRKKEMNAYAKYVKSLKSRYFNIEIDCGNFFDSVATKSTYLFYLTEKNFQSLKLQSRTVEINKDEVTLYEVIDVLEAVLKNKTPIRFKIDKYKNTLESKLIFINSCFKTIEKTRKAEELRAKLIIKDESTVKARKKI